MTKRSEGWAMLDDAIETMGADGLLQMFCSRIADGEDPRRIAQSAGMPWNVMRKWLEDSPERMEGFALAKRCFADGLIWEGLKVVQEATPEDVAVARLKKETYHDVAGKMSRSEWGKGDALPAGIGSGGITIVIGEVKSPYLPAPVEGEVIEQVSDGARAEA